MIRKTFPVLHRLSFEPTQRRNEVPESPLIQFNGLLLCSFADAIHACTWVVSGKILRRCKFRRSFKKAIFCVVCGQLKEIKMSIRSSNKNEPPELCKLRGLSSAQMDILSFSSLYHSVNRNSSCCFSHTLELQELRFSKLRAVRVQLIRARFQCLQHGNLGIRKELIHINFLFRSHGLSP